MGFEREYAAKLKRLIDEMNRSVIYWVSAAYKANPPEMAQDASPAKTLETVMKGLGKRWNARFAKAAKDLAEYFAKGVSERTNAQLRAILKEAGFSVKFTMTRAVNDIVQASIAENVQLIKSIPQQYLTQVQGAVMRSVATGRDLQSLVKHIEDHYDVTRRRAEFIALDQNNKSTANIMRARQVEMGLEAEWMHSGGGKEPRPSHVAFSGNRYDPAKGAMIDGELIFPGQLPRCRCVAKTILPWRKTA